MFFFEPDKFVGIPSAALPVDDLTRVALMVSIKNRFDEFEAFYHVLVLFLS